jgi:hypothetical protein
MSTGGLLAACNRIVHCSMAVIRRGGERDRRGVDERGCHRDDRGRRCHGETILDEADSARVCHVDLTGGVNRA